MNIKTAEKQLVEAKRLLEQARDLLSQETVTDEQRAEATALRERAMKMRSDADLLHSIESATKNLVVAETEEKNAEKPAGQWGDFGDYVGAILEAKAGGQRDPRLFWVPRDSEDIKMDQQQSRARKALSGATGATGGFLMPEQFLPAMQQAMLTQSTVMPRVTRIPMAARTVNLPVVDYTQTLPEGEPRQFGGVQAFYQNEGDESEDSEPKFREHTLTAHELAIYTEANNSLLADAGVSLEAFLNSSMGMGGALTWKIEYKLFRGTGVGQPLGIVNAPCTIAVAREAANLVEYLDLARMDENALPSSGLAWWASISLKSQLRMLKDDANNNIWAEAAAGLPATLLGYPIYFTDKLPRIGSKGDIVLADWSYYLFGDRQAATLDVSAEASFRRNRTAFRLIHRHDGSPWMNAPMTLADTLTEVSPFVVLDSTVS
ncbi:MAG: phage major capsid protein [Anaerolineae bacterium]|nr:phage major capsid protein [Anaerolineae bacterium]NUQ06891.1 phage major capsid protein [Anaerolineae bacterium]